MRLRVFMMLAIAVLFTVSCKSKNENDVKAAALQLYEVCDRQESDYLFSLLPQEVLESEEFRLLQTGNIGFSISCVAPSDTAAVNSIVRHLSNRNVRFMWMCIKYPGDTLFELYALKLNADGSAAMEGDIIKNAEGMYDTNGEPGIKIELTENAAREFEKLTARNIGKGIAIVINDSLYSLPVVNDAISGGTVMILGDFTVKESKELAEMLNASRNRSVESGSKKNTSAENPSGKPVVYMTKEITPEGLVKVYEALGVVPEGRVAVKISTGEPGGHNFLQPSLIKDFVNKVNGTIVECNTAYKGPRFETETHMKVFEEHGFTAIAPVDLLDGYGEVKIPVKDTTHIKYNIVGKNMLNYDWMVNLAHFKGHAMGGFGGVLKNQSIGIASSNGKAYIHSAGAIEDKELIWKHTAEQDKFIESMAAAAQSVHDYFEGRVIYINVMNNLSVDCDCDSSPADPEMKDVGILASLDPVALDQACVDLVFNYPSTDEDNAAALIERINSRHGVHILEHANKIGLGSREYVLERIDE